MTMPKLNKPHRDCKPVNLLTRALRGLLWSGVGFCAGALPLYASGGAGPHMLAAESGAFEDPVTWEDHAAPVLKARCAACHNPDKKSADLDVTTYTGIMAGGASGASIEPGDPSASYLYNLVTHEDEPSMPPGGTKIPDPEIEIIAKWISGGALETKTSKARAKKRGPSLAGGGSSLTRPENVAVFPRMRMEPLLRLPRGGTVSAMTTHPWAPILAVAVPRQILLFDTNSLQLTGILEFPEGTAQILRFSRSGEILLAGGGKDGASGRVVLWDVRSGSRFAEIGDELDAVLAADISSDHSLVALGSPQKVVRVYSTADGALRYELKKHTDWITSLEFSPDSVLLATGDRNGGLFVWHAPTGNEYLALPGHTGAIVSTTWRMDSNVLVSGSEDTTVKAWEMENGGQIKSIGAHGGGVTMALFDRDNNLYTSGRDLTVKAWNPAGDALRTYPALPDIATAAAVSLESSKVFGGDWQGNLVAWNLADGTEAGRLALNPPTLAERLAEAQNALAGIQQTHQAASAEMGQLQETLAAAQAALAAAMTEAQTIEPAIVAMQNEMTALVAERDANMQQAEAWQAESGTLQSVLPELKVLADQAAKVLALSPTDAQLVATDQQVREKVVASEQRIAEIAQALEKSTARNVEIDTRKATLEQTLTADQAKLAAVVARVETQKQEVAGIETTVAAASSRLQELSQQLAAADAAVQHWNGEIAFVAAWDQLQSGIAAVDTEIDAALTVKEQAEAELARVQAAVAQAAEGVAAAEQKRQELEVQLKTLRGIPQDP